jgi:hypothetical protein
MVAFTFTEITSSNLDYLITPLRLYIGDTSSTSYRYLDSWLRIALVQAVKDLQRWWGFKYLVDNDNNVYRNPDITFSYPETEGLIQDGDEKPIILMASIILKLGQLENSSWNTGSWKDAEISYSNIEGGKIKNESLRRDWEALTQLLKPPTKRLINFKRQSILEELV